MNYSFGYRMYDGKEVEYMRVDSENGYTSFAENRFMEITLNKENISQHHTCRIIRKYKDEIVNNNYVSWYLIDNHSYYNDLASNVDDKLSDHDKLIDELLVAILGGK